MLPFTLFSFGGLGRSCTRVPTTSALLLGTRVVQAPFLPDVRFLSCVNNVGSVVLVHIDG